MTGTAAQAAEAWQPIETAPKDGTRILIFREGVVHIAQWIDDLQKTWASVVERIPGEFTTYTDLGDIGFPECLVARGPSHWMPLPSPPPVLRAAQTTGGDGR